MGAVQEKQAKSVYQASVTETICAAVNLGFSGDPILLAADKHLTKLQQHVYSAKKNADLADRDPDEITETTFSSLQ